MMAQWLVHLLHKQKVGVQFPVMAPAFFPTSIFYLPFPTSVGKVIELTGKIHSRSNLGPPSLDPMIFRFRGKQTELAEKASLKRNLQLYARAGFSGCGNNNSRMLERINCS